MSMVMVMGLMFTHFFTSIQFVMLGNYIFHMYNVRINILPYFIRYKGVLTMKQKYHLYLLYNSIFLVFLGISLVIPVMPSIMNELDISGSGVGYLTAAFAMTQLIFSPF